MRPVAGFEDDKNINMKMAVRSLVADMMLTIGAVAAYYNEGLYFFVFPNKKRHYTAQYLQQDMIYYETGSEQTKYGLDMIIALGKMFEVSDTPPSFPIIDPIYFGT